MINSKIVLSILVLVGISFSACKKSENDPFLSLKTRNARLIGEWELVSSEETIQYTDRFDDIFIEGSSSRVFENGSLTSKGITTYTFEDEVITELEPETVINYTHRLQINKDGTFKNSITEGEELEEIVENWRWVDNSKKKTGLFLMEDIYQIDRLTNSELILKTSRTVINIEIGNEADGEISLLQTFKKL